MMTFKKHSHPLDCGWNNSKTVFINLSLEGVGDSIKHVECDKEGSTDH